MKGVIALAVKELIEKKFGQSAWKEILEKAGITKEPMLLPITDVDDKIILNILDSIASVLKLTPTQVADAFGEFWVMEYSQKLYKHYYTAAKNAKEFLLKMDEVHASITKKMANSKPPRFEYEWSDNRTLIMKYKSSRGLIDIMVGLIKGVAKYYKENLKITKLGRDKVQIVFPY